MIIKYGRKLVVSLAVSVAVYLLISVGLTFSQWSGKTDRSEGLNFDKLEKTEADSNSPLITYTTRNGSRLQYRHYTSDRENAPLVILIHGSGWHGGAYLKLAGALSSDAEILVPDLRGHGPNPERRGDIDYLGQLEDDIADLIKHKRHKGQRVVLAGHSSGGGLVIRFAGGRYGKLLDGAVLIAPYLKYNAPTVRPQSGGWAYPLTRRIIGLSMLNGVGVSYFNDLKVIQFNFPENILEGPKGHTATTAYSYRLQQSYSPRSDYLKDIEALPRFVLVAGKVDEAFFAEQYEQTLSKVTNKGKYYILDGLSHFSVINSEETRNLIQQFLREL